MSTPEGKVKAKVSKALAKLPKAYKFMPVQNGMGAPGLDYFCCINGLFVAIETKVPGKHMTDRQKITRDNIEAAGGLVFEIHDQDEIDTMLAQIALHLRFFPTPNQENSNGQQDQARRPKAQATPAS